MGTLNRRSRRAGAFTLAAAIGVLAPGVGPMTVSALAQEAGEERATWMPPAPELSFLPRATGEPPEEFEKSNQCVSSNAGDELNIGKNDDKILKNKPWGQMHLQLDKVHQYVRSHSKDGTVGGGIKVAVIDTGVTPHAFFQNRIESGADYVAEPDNGAKPGLQDCDGHGTQVAGIIAGNPQRPDVGFIGVAPDAEIVSFRQTSQSYKAKTEEQKAREAEQKKREEEAKKQAAEAKRALEAANRKAEEAARRAEEAQKEAEKNKGDGDTTAGQTSPGQAGPPPDPRTIEGGESAGNLHTLAMALRQAVDTPGVKVVNMSIDSCRPSLGDFRTLDVKERELQAAVRYAVNKDVVVVAAAGNVGGSCAQNGDPDPNNPSAVPDPSKPATIVTPPWFSEDLLAVGAIDESGSAASFSMRGPWVSVAAPGTSVISLDPAEGSNKLANQMIEGNQPQLMKGTSFASPYVAGLAALIRQLRPELKAREVMDRIQRTAQHPGAPGGRDQFVGHGVINPMAALTATLPEEIGLKPATVIALPSDMPPPGGPDRTPIIVALAGSAGAAAALGIVLFSVQAVRRRQRRAEGMPS